MGLQDYTYRLKAQAGDSTPHDELSVSGDLSGGTITLQDNSGDYAWRFVGQALAAVPSKAIAVSSDGGGATIAVRLKVVTPSGTTSGNYAGYMTTGGAYRLGLIRYSSTQIRGRYSYSGYLDTATLQTHGTGFLTYVLKIKCMAASNQDATQLWVTGGSGDSPDHASAGNNALTNTLAALYIGQSDSTVEVSDVVIWGEEVSDADCRLLATDLRGTLDGGTTHNVTISNSNQANVASTGSIALDTTTYVAGSNSTQPNVCSIGAIYSAAGGTLTTPPLKNNTGTLLANETGATVYVYSVSTGALVVSKTGQSTNASGVMTINGALIVAATQYRVIVVLGSGAEGMDKLTAS